MKTRDRLFRGIIVSLLMAALGLAGLSAPALAAGNQVLTGLGGDTSAQTDARTKALRTWLQGVADQEEIPGAALLVAQGGQVLFREARGFADPAGKTPLTPETLVLTASSTKPLSATGVMTLVDEGKLSLDDKVSKYLPRFGQLQPAVEGGQAGSPTIRQLLSHTSGLFGLVGATKQGMRAVRDFSLTLEQSVEIIAAEKLTSEPGTKFNYGGANFQVAARIAELISGKPFDVFMQERLFGPLKMGGTFFRPSGGQGSAPAAVPCMYKKDKGLIPVAAYLPDPNRKLILASGGLYSGLDDLAVFLQMHLNGGSYGPAKVLSAEAVAAMQTRQTGPAKTPYGLGWFLTGLDEKERAGAVNHPGLFGAVIWLDRSRDLVGVFLTSSLWPGRQKTNQEVMGKVAELFPAGQ